MAQSYDVIARIVSIDRGACSLGHTVGQEWLISETAPAGLCAWAFHTLFPAIETLMYGGDFPWEPVAGTARVVCPDPGVPVVFELRRVPHQE
jgi:uncharacterized repeat protein (TIGR04076 family)